MSYLKPALWALLIQVGALFASLFVLLALPFIQWDAEPSVDPSGHFPTIRGRI